MYINTVHNEDMTKSLTLQHMQHLNSQAVTVRLP
jgi:hypothetical protein